MTKIAYLARPADQVGREPEWLPACERIDQILQVCGYHVYRPAEAWRVDLTAPPSPEIEQVNRAALAMADLMVAYLPAGVPTIGVPMEIEVAASLGRAIIVVTDISNSYALARDEITIVGVELDRELPTAIGRIEQTHPWFQRTPDIDRSPDILQLVVRDGHPQPRRAYPDDAGIDLTCVTRYTINPGQFVDVHTQVDAVQLPDGYWGMITGRSSTLRKWGLFIPVGVIDPGWRGPLFVGVWNLGRTQVEVEPGQRLGQLILVPNHPAAIMGVDKVGDAARGLAGFGSTDEGMPR